MQLDVVDILFAALWPPAFAASGALVRRAVRRPWSSASFWEVWFFGGIGSIFANVTDGDTPAALVGIAQTLLAALMWWLSRRKRKRAPKLAGAKAKALRDVLVRTMRERVRPRRVLRPVPGGAW